MDIMRLENATKSIFMQCLNDPEIMETIKRSLNCIDKPLDIRAEQTQKIDDDKFDGGSNVDNATIIKKIDEILANQRSMEEFIRIETNKKVENIAQKLNQEKKNHSLELEKLKEKYEKEIDKYKEKNDNLLSIKKTREEDIEKLSCKYSICEEILEIWNHINSLNRDNRDYIDDLCGGDGILAILSLGRDESKIDQLWSYLRDVAIKGDVDKEAVLILNRYFEFCIKVRNSTKLDSEKYIISDVEIGSEFDMAQCIRTTDSKQIGSIKDVIVKRFLIGNNTKFKAIVRVG